MAATTTSSPFTRAVVSAIQNVYPEHLADKSFDNTGLLLEAPFDPKRTVQKNSVLLANDVTGAVVDEAIERRDSVIVAYRQSSQQRLDMKGSVLNTTGKIQSSSVG